MVARGSIGILARFRSPSSFEPGQLLPSLCEVYLRVVAAGLFPKTPPAILPRIGWPRSDLRHIFLRVSAPAKVKYPLATIAPYGPNNRQATKLVVAIFPQPQKEPATLKKWTVASGDIRNEATVNAEVVHFLREHKVANAVFADRILGCPHEAGTDYPEGDPCPFCPFWMGVNRFTHQSEAQIGRNDPCPCGGGKKYKKCCGAT